MRRLALSVVGLGAACLFVIAPAGGPSAAGRPAWGCAPERIGFTVADGPPTGGAPTALAGARELSSFLAADSGLPEQRYDDAFSNHVGPTSYDPTTGYLLIDGALEARIGVGPLADGTWSVGSIEHCMRPPPADASPGPTPSDQGDPTHD